MQDNNIVHKMVSECMTPSPITVDRYKTVFEANELMKLKKIRRLPVLDDDKLVGIVSWSDILEARPTTIKSGNTFREVDNISTKIIVDLVMSKNPLTIYQTDTIGHAAEMMLENKIGGLPVLDGSHKLVGVITESDIFRQIVTRWREDNMRMA
ncbi:MAG: CBS domain-containing protein [Gammaproteobacteria bacterium]